MKIIIVFLLIAILTIFLFNFLNYRRRKTTYLNAGKKWDNIVEELSRRR